MLFTCKSGISVLDSGGVFGSNQISHIELSKGDEPRGPENHHQNEEKGNDNPFQYFKGA
jgi:hypothetical protein